MVDLSLVDPDNRRPVDYDVRRDRLAYLDGGGTPRDLDDEKLLVTSRALRLRREWPAWFVDERARYDQLVTTDEHALAVQRRDGERTGAVAVVTRLSVRLQERGGWGEATVLLPEAGPWHDLLTGRLVETDDQGRLRLADLFDTLPVALLSRHDILVRDELDTT
jgi:(1->4)-alpha-D-glucan 1-alpha-D-glucosylmutase